MSEYEETHLRESALNTVVGKIISSMISIELKSTDNNLHYLLNVKANNNMNSTEFKTKLLNRLILDGEALVLNINDMLYVADSFNVDESKETGFYKYQDIVINQFDMKKTYSADEVLYFSYHNKDLNKFLEKLDKSYARLFDRLVDVHMREQQLRLFANFKFVSNGPKSQQEQFEDFQKYLRGVKQQIENESIAVVPKQDDYDVEEKSQSYLGRSVTELSDLEQMYVKQVANALQVPPLLFSGDLADVSQHRESYITDCIKPLAKLIATEFNAKYFNKEEYESGARVTYNLIPLIYNSELDMAKDVRTAMESGNWTINHINEMLGRKKEDTQLADKRFITLNVAPLNDDGTIDNGKHETVVEVNE